eukprot:GHVU01026641.1.p2 GENE.GHVU01026641.1~~GHVU01026641.1.p2  ORF type:complete len:108 (-),score=7.45 GHVU01026641.1:579-902(-)
MHTLTHTCVHMHIARRHTHTRAYTHVYANIRAHKFMHTDTPTHTPVTAASSRFTMTRSRPDLISKCIITTQKAQAQRGDHRFGAASPLSPSPSLPQQHQQQQRPESR